MSGRHFSLGSGEGFEWNCKKHKPNCPMTRVGKIHFLKSGLAAGLFFLALLPASKAFELRGEEPAGRTDGGAGEAAGTKQVPPGMLGSWIWDAKTV